MPTGHAPMDGSAVPMAAEGGAQESHLDLSTMPGAIMPGAMGSTDACSSEEAAHRQQKASSNSKGP